MKKKKTRSQLRAFFGKVMKKLKKPSKPSMIKLQPVKSSNIHSMGYEASTKKLQVRFRKGKGKSLPYEYPNFPESRYKGLMKAKSKGKYFHKHVRHLPFKKIGE